MIISVFTYIVRFLDSLAVMVMTNAADMNFGGVTGPHPPTPTPKPGMYDGYSYIDPGGDYSIYFLFMGNLKRYSGGVFYLILTAGVFIAAIAVIVSAVMLLTAAGRGPVALDEAKRHVKRVIIVSVLIFSVTCVLQLIVNMGADFN